MKLQNAHIMYDSNKDQVVILNRPSDGSAMTALPADMEFIHAMLMWLEEGALAWGIWGRLWNTITRALLRRTSTRRIVTDKNGNHYTITLTSKKGK